MKITFLGDSLTWGGYGGSFVAEIQKRLPQHDIINAGVGGNTVINLLRRLDAVLDDEPDGVFVMTGGNDAISNIYPETRPYYKKAQAIPDGIVSPEQFAQTYRELLTQIQMRHTLAWVGLPPLEYSRELVDELGRYNTLARESAQAFNIPVLDLMREFVPAEIPQRPPLTLKEINLIGEHIQSGWADYEAAQQAGDYTFTFDGLHPMPESAARMADLIIDFLKLTD
jgi:lysophospholipase L1-like esterase